MGTVSQLRFDQRGTPLHDATFVVVDLETSGLRPATDAITEIGAVKICGGEIIGEFASFVQIDTPLSAHITALTGITDQMLAAAPPLTAVLPQFLSFSADCTLVAHNAPFDLGFLRDAVATIYAEPFTPQTVDTVRLARRILGDEVHNFRLATLAQRFRSPVLPDHRALSDARATVHVFHALIERAAGFGATTVEDLIELSRTHTARHTGQRSLVADAPHAPGVYRFIGANNDTLYIGKATDLKQRLRSYFTTDPRRRITTLVRETTAVRWHVTPTVLDAEIRELRAIMTEQPRFNVQHRYPQRHVDVALTDEAFPRVKIVTHDPNATNVWRVGPFASHRSAARFVTALNDTTGLRACSMPIRRAQNHPCCIRKALGLCPAPCDATVDRDTYQQTVAAARSAFTDPTPLLDKLRAMMTQCAGDHRFEDASERRDTLHGLAFALWQIRILTAVRNAGTVCALRHTDAGTETVLCHDGALVATAAHAGQLTAGEAMSWADTIDVPPALAPPTRAETLLIASWLFTANTVLICATNPLSFPMQAGNALACTVREGRAARRDQQRTARRQHTFD